MIAAVLIFSIINSIILLFVSRLWAPLPLLIGACYMTLGQRLEMGPFSFSVLRLMIAVGFVRIAIKGERISGGVNLLDIFMILWGCWAICSSAFHALPKEALIFRLGVVYDVIGVYLLIRIFCRSEYHVLHMATIAALLLFPVAVEMFQEHLTGKNLFSVFGGVSEAVMIRDGRVRAQGPFLHPILAGSSGAICLPLFVGIIQYRPKIASIGILSSVLMATMSLSSGPIMTLASGLFAIFMWRWRQMTRTFWCVSVVMYVALDCVMSSPAYFLMARIDLTGSSTGWHRAQLIRSSIMHLDEWWFAGTDYTRHWMPTGVTWSSDHTDITNYYLKMGVWGGLPLMFLFIAIIVCSFYYVSQCLRLKKGSKRNKFMVWTLGSALFAGAVTGISVSYFDQSFLFVFMNIASISSLRQNVILCSSSSSSVLLTPPRI